MKRKPEAAWRVPHPMRDLLLPRTDAGVLVQALVVFPALLIALFLVRRHREGRTFVFGLIVLLLSLFGLRAVH